MSKELKLPSGFVVDNECIEVIKDNICNRIYVRQQRGENEGFDIYLRNYGFAIKYNRKMYKVAVVKKDDKLLWYLTPFNKSYFTSPAKDRNSFDIVIHAIIEHDENFKK